MLPSRTYGTTQADHEYTTNPLRGPLTHPGFAGALGGAGVDAIGVARVKFWVVREDEVKRVLGVDVARKRSSQDAAKGPPVPHHHVALVPHALVVAVPEDGHASWPLPDCQAARSPEV